MVVKIPKKLEMKSLLPAPRSPLPAHVLAFPEIALRNREALVASDLHYVGALFNPHLIKDMELCDHKNAMAGLMRVFQKTHRHRRGVPSRES
jgi:hypothetical protein